MRPDPAPIALPAASRGAAAVLAFTAALFAVAAVGLVVAAGAYAAERDVYFAANAVFRWSIVAGIGFGVAAAGGFAWVMKGNAWAKAREGLVFALFVAGWSAACFGFVFGVRGAWFATDVRDDAAPAETLEAVVSGTTAREGRRGAVSEYTVILEFPAQPGRTLELDLPRARAAGMKEGARFTIALHPGARGIAWVARKDLGGK